MNYVCIYVPGDKYPEAKATAWIAPQQHNDSISVQKETPPEAATNLCPKTPTPQFPPHPSQHNSTSHALNNPNSITNSVARQKP